MQQMNKVEMNTFKKINDYKISQRVNYLKNKALDTKPHICTERAKIYTEAYKMYADEPLYKKRALALRDTLEKISIYIGDKELIVGNHSYMDRAAPIFPEYSVDWIMEEIDDFEKRPGDKFIIDGDRKTELLEICKFWKKRTVKDKALKIMPPKIRQFYDLGIVKAEGNITSGSGHVIIDYKTVLEKGLEAIRSEVEEKLSFLDQSQFENNSKRIFYESTIIVLDACIRFAERFSKLAKSLADAEEDNKRKKELLKISDICRKVPKDPAYSFYEALQSVWFIHLILQIESNGHSMSLGRLDQYLYPYFKRDIDNEVISYDEVLELLQCLWLKMFCINKLRPWSHTRFSPGSPLYQNVTIGGQTRDGRDATNELSRLILRSVAIVRLTQPLLTPRLHKGTPNYFLEEIVDVINLGFGMPALINDEVIVDGMLNIGLGKEDALDYAIVGCIEPAMPGKWGYRPTGMSFVNLMKILNLALSDGYSLNNNEEIHKGSGRTLSDFNTFEELLNALEYQLRFFTKAQVFLDAVADFTLENNVPDVLCSSLTRDCIDKAKNLFEGGARYDWISGLLVGNANIANALAAMRYLIFDHEIISGEQLLDVLKGNFETEEGVLIRKLISNKPPKYGNDDDYVDLLLRKVFEIYIDEISKYKNLRCGRGPESCGYYAGTSSLTANVAMGSSTEATPDGRKFGEPFAEGCSPAHASDVSGPTAVLKSVSKLPARYILGGVLLNQKFNPSYIKSEYGIEKFTSLIKTFFNDLKGFHVQFNVVTKEKLRDAQKNPEKYKDLIVRVAGYSALFTQLSPEIQEDIINRTEQNL